MNYNTQSIIKELIYQVNINYENENCVEIWKLEIMKLIKEHFKNEDYYFEVNKMINNSFIFDLIKVECIVDVMDNVLIESDFKDTKIILNGSKEECVDMETCKKYLMKYVDDCKKLSNEHLEIKNMLGDKRFDSKEILELYKRENVLYVGYLMEYYVSLVKIKVIEFFEMLKEIGGCKITSRRVFLFLKGESLINGLKDECCKIIELLLNNVEMFRIILKVVCEICMNIGKMQMIVDGYNFELVDNSFDVNVDKFDKKILIKIVKKMILEVEMKNFLKLFK